MAKKKELNYYQTKKINEQLKKNREAIDIDKVELDIRQMLVLNGFSMGEIAALLYTVMEKILKYPNNLKTLEGAGLTVNNLNIETVTAVQKLLIKEYVNGLNDTNTAKRSQ